MQPKEYPGEYRGTVTSLDDPKKQMRVQVRVFDLFDGIPNEDLPWATYHLPLGSRPNDGSLCPVQTGDLVWVRFGNGDSREPIITGSCAFMPGGKPNLSHDQWNGPDKYQHKRAKGEPIPEPPGYHEDVVFKQHDVLLQITKSSTPRVTQLPSGSALEIAPGGVIVVHSENSILMSSPNRIFMQVGPSSIEITPDGIKVKSPRIDLN